MPPTAPKAAASEPAGSNKIAFEWKLGKVEFDADASANKEKLGAGVVANARVLDVDVGPARMELGLGLDTGAGIGTKGVEAKFLGTGFKVGKTVELMCLGSSVSLDLTKVGDVFKGK